MSKTHIAFLPAFCLLALQAGADIRSFASDFVPPTLDAGWVGNRFVTAAGEVVATDEIQSAGDLNLGGTYIYELKAPALFRITDGFTVGDGWSVYDFAAPILETAPAIVDLKNPPSPYCTSGDQCWIDSHYGKGAAILSAGRHELTVRGDASAGSPAHFFARIDYLGCPRAGTPVVVAGEEDVIVTFRGSGARFSNDLYLHSPPGQYPSIIFNTKTAKPGDQANLGKFPPGTELVFRIHVNDRGVDYFSGDISRNPDSLPHARVTDHLEGTQTLVEFEDLRGLPECSRGGAYKDFSFTFANVKMLAPSEESKIITPSIPVNQSYFPLDPFLIYKLKSSSAVNHSKLPILLKDQFDEHKFRLTKPKILAAPAVIDEEIIENPEVALTGYPIKDTGKRHRKRVAINNQFGPLQLTLLKANRFLVPSVVHLDGTLDAPDPAKHSVESFKCYTAKITLGAPKFRKGVRVKAVDPYTDRTETLRLKKPTSLCAPAVSSSGEMANPNTHLMCYRVTSGKGQSGKRPLTELNYSNALSVGTLTTLRADELCVPTAVAR